MNSSELGPQTEGVVNSHKETGAFLSIVGGEIEKRGRRIEELGSVFGSCIGGVESAIVEDFLCQELRMDNSSMRHQIHKNGEREEYGVIATRNGQDQRGIVLEIESQLGEYEVSRMKEKMDRLFYWKPDLKGKKFEGMVAFVDADEESRRAVLKNGWHLVQVGDEIFEVKTPEGFIPKIYEASPDAGE